MKLMLQKNKEYVIDDKKQISSSFGHFHSESLKDCCVIITTVWCSMGRKGMELKLLWRGCSLMTAMNWRTILKTLCRKKCLYRKKRKKLVLKAVRGRSTFKQTFNLINPSLKKNKLLRLFNDKNFCLKIFCQRKSLISVIKTKIVLKK